MHPDALWIRLGERGDVVTKVTDALFDHWDEPIDRCWPIGVDEPQHPFVAIRRCLPSKVAAAFVRGQRGEPVDGIGEIADAGTGSGMIEVEQHRGCCLLYTSDAAD